MSLGFQDPLTLHSSHVYPEECLPKMEEAGWHADATAVPGELNMIYYAAFYDRRRLWIISSQPGKILVCFGKVESEERPGLSEREATNTEAETHVTIPPRCINRE